MPLHPQAAAVLGPGPHLWRDPDEIAAMTAEKARAWAADAIGDATPTLPPGVVMEEIEVPGAVGPMPARVYRSSTEAPAGTVVWIRGGGFVLGSLALDPIPAHLAVASECTVVAVDYRMAPEHPFPAPLEDCYAALCWASEHAERLGGHAGPIAVGGESAGGNLAAAVALAARDRGGPELALQVLLVPMVARVFDAPSRRDPEVGAHASAEAIEWLWQQYIGDRDGSDPLACPLSAPTLAGLPPAVVITAEYDVLRDEGEAYAQRLEREGVPVELHRYDGMHHGFGDAVGSIDAAGECIALMGTAFRRALAVEVGRP